MIKINKKPLPIGVEIKQETDYRSGRIFNLLVEYCFNKCYICEDKTATSLNVEHRISHQGNNQLKYDWNNLFLSCGHCNSAKGNNFDGMIDPCITDPESVLELRIETDNLIERVIITQLVDDYSVSMTADLLEKVYNGEPTAIKRVEAANLRNKISADLLRFRQYIMNYKIEPDLGYADIIADEISQSSAFAAFKRQMIRDDPELGNLQRIFQKT
jgi:hypothetical protein